MKIAVQRAHGLTVEALRGRTEERIAYYDGRYPQLRLREHFRWVAPDRAEGSYRGGHGAVTLGDANVQVQLDIPLLLRPFKGRIEGFIEQELNAVLAPV